MSSLPAVPPRPSKSSASSPPDSSAPAPPSIPARPARNRSKSPLPKSGGEDTSEVPEVRFEEAQETSSERPSSPETRRKIDPGLDLHAPMAVRPANENAAGYVDNTLPPEIGQRVPMLDFAGDVQAPTPLGPDSRSVSRAKRRSQHTPSVPAGDGPMIVGDYGAYPTGNIYRQNGSYSLSHDDLIKSVMQAKGAGVATTPGLEGVPDEEIGYLASDEIASRTITPQATPGGITGANETKLPAKSPLATEVSALESENDAKHQLQDLDDSGNDGNAVYGRSGFATSSTSLGPPTSGRQTPWEEFQDEHHDGTPILASDQAGKFPVWNPPAISPRLSAQEVRRPPSSTKSRQSPSLLPEEDISEPSSPTKEHVPLFPEGAPKVPQRPKLTDKQSKSFPSQDIWEDAPESIHVTYEVQHGEEEENPDPEYYDPRAKKLREAAAAAAAAAESEDSKEASDPAKDSAAAPPLPTHRPAKRVPTDETSPVSPESKQAPTIPGRPKPSIPPRPAKKGSETTEESSSPEEVRSPPATKQKPMVPPKVGGGIAALRANFMNDLNSRLSKGPQAPKKEDPVEAPEAEPKEREPLEDVRKTRARGPAKRKPTTTATGDAAPSGPKLTFSSIITVYSIGDDYEVSFDETKFDDEPSKIARPMHVEEAVLKGEDVDTGKQVTAVDASATIAPETEDEAISTEESKPEPTEEKVVMA